MKIQDITNEAVSGNLLYHATKIENAIKNLRDNSIKGYTSQRAWPDGVVRKDDDPLYDQHHILKGISTTRDFDFAKKFAGIVYVLDKDLIRQRYKIVPYNWGYLIGGGYIQTDKKREREEFVILNVLKKSYNELIDEWEQKYIHYDDGDEPEDFIDKFDYMFQPIGELKPLDKYLKGIFVNKDIVEIYGEDNEMVQEIMNHPKFRGIIN